VPVTRGSPEELLGHHAAAGIADAHEQDAAHANSSGTAGSLISPGRVGSPRTYW
jgi:hypothetical protein